ncbi:MAG: tetratricopeptide repeat protein, partial [Bacillota bacterium]|nr:tetratricopeptide repeat protein [Bacillota bacterium]
YIFPRMSWQSPISGGQENLLVRGVTKYELLLEHFPDTVWAVHALQQLGHAYYDLGDFTKAESFFLASIAENGDAESSHSLARLYLGRGEYRVALDIAEESLARQPDHLALDMMLIRGQALLALGEWDEAEKVFRAIWQKAQEDFERFPEDEDEGAPARNTNHWTDTANLYLEQLSRLQSGGGSGSVTGRVTLGGSDFSGVRVYLVDTTLDRPYFGTAEVDTLRQVVTNEEGRFIFNEVAPGTYAFGVAVRISDVEGYTLREQSNFEVIPGKNTNQTL